MSITEVAGGGHAPSVLIRPIPPKEPVNPEQARYEEMWKREEYRSVSPGEQTAMMFLQQVRAPRDAEVVDLGCGTGRGGLMLALVGGLRVRLVDFAANCLDSEVRDICEKQPDRMWFEQHDLTKTLPFQVAYGYCTDVMEHIPTDLVERVLRNILTSARHVFFSIALFDDIHGPASGAGPLHLTVKPAEWWIEKLAKMGCAIHWSSRDDLYVQVYCTLWKDASDVIETGKVNVELSVLDEQCTENIKAGWLHATPHNKQDREVIVLCGGPSMNDCVDEIKKLRAEGAGLVTVNGAYKWALDHGLEPSVQIVLDARAFNARFTKPVTAYTKYLIASQCHPSTLEGLPRERTFLWHSGLTEENEKLIVEREGVFFPTPGGSTVVLRAIPLLRMLGFWRLHLFGFDSCVRKGGAHHAYEQKENDGEPLFAVECGGETFECAPWMVSQASEFRDIVKCMGDEIELAVYGDGLIHKMLETGASFSAKE